MPIWLPLALPATINVMPYDPPVLFRLQYRLEGEVSFDNPPPRNWNPGPFELTLTNGKATVEMCARFADEAEARNIVRPFLRGWEIEEALGTTNGGFRFVFESATVSSRETTSYKHTASVRFSQIACEVLVEGPPKRSAYPLPPTILVDADVEMLWDRFQQYKRRGEPLASAAYFCLTLLELRGGGRKGAAAHYGISFEVLRTLGELTGDIGDAMGARKAKVGHWRAFTNREVAWTEACVKAIIRRVGELAAGAMNLPTITMANLPKL
jgi:hypothetical protein